MKKIFPNRIVRIKRKAGIVSPKQAKNNLAYKPNNTYLMLIAKDEDKYIDEWIDYHLSIGVSKIFVFEDEWNYDLSKFGNKVEVFHNEDFPGGTEKHTVAKQMSFYSAILEKVKKYHICKYIAAIDTDEFIGFKEQDFGLTITEILDKYFGKYGCEVLQVPWKMFGDNNLTTVEDGNYSVIGRFTRCAKDYGDCGRNNLCKVILDVEHFSSFTYPFYHGCDKHKQVFVTGLSTSGANVLNKQKFKDEEIGLYLAHYYTKTKEEYFARAKAPYTYDIIGTTNEAQWKDRSNPIWNRNDIENLEIQKVRDYYRNTDKKYINLCHWLFPNREKVEFNFVEKFHLHYLKLNARLLDRVDLYVALETDKPEYRTLVETELADFDNININFVKNEKSQEYNTWHKLLTDYKNCYVYYNHFKGMGHIKNKDMSTERMKNILYWSYLLHEFNLGKPYMASKCFSGNINSYEGHCFLGHYQGTFYWCDIDKLKKNFSVKNLKFKSGTYGFPFSIAYCCEEFPSLLPESTRKYEYGFSDAVSIYEIFDKNYMLLLRKEFEDLISSLASSEF